VWLLGVFALPAHAQNLTSATYTTLLDVDNSAATGCTVDTVAGVFQGADSRLVTTVDITATAAAVSGVELQTCSGGAWGAPVWQAGGGWPVGQGNGSSGAAVVETYVPLSQLGANTQVRAGVTSQAASLSDAILTSAGQPILIQLAAAQPSSIPTLGSPALIALILLTAAFAWLAFHKGWGSVSLVIVALTFTLSGLVWAAFSRDGQITDWAGIPPLATQSSAVPEPAKLLAFFGRVQDGSLNLRIDAGIDFSELIVNQSPQVDAGTDQSITLPAAANLDATVTDDGLPDPPGALTLTWSQVSGPGTATFADASAADTSVTFSAAGTYELSLTANDEALSDSDSVRIVVSAPAATNQAPQVDAGDDQSITLPAAANLDAIVTDDGLPNPPGALTLAWSQVSGPGTATFTDASTDDTRVSFSMDGDYVLRLTADDGDLSHSDTLTVTVAPDDGLPPDPKDVAPLIDPTVATTTFAATEFLYSGTDAIQTRVAPGTIEPERAAVIRGRILGRDDSPLSGVTISIKDHPEFGQTLSRADGWFDLAVNGGGTLTLSYGKTAYLPVQRLLDVPCQDFIIAPDVVMIPLDAQVTAINLNSSEPFQVARGSVVSDANGQRQATVLFPAGTSTTMTLPDGTIQPLSTLSVRATEFTVGENGPESMPGPLPAASGYTYAIELSADEAIAAGATRVDFDRPIPFYVDNFLDFPVGEVVPVGFYDYDKSAWIPSANGRIIKILSIDGEGRAILDLDGDSLADNAVALTALGITDAERIKLTEFYATGSTLWRVQIEHLTPWDCNWPYGPPPDATPPPSDPPEQPNEDEPDPEDDNECDGCLVQPLRQVLGETIPLVGTPFDLTYRSDRSSGFVRQLEVPLSGDASTLSSALRGIDLRIEIAGNRIERSFPPDPNQVFTWLWDGLDAYGREAFGRQTASIIVTYLYSPFYYEARNSFGRSFAQFADPAMEVIGDGNLETIRIERAWTEILTDVRFSVRQSGLGDWTPQIHHALIADELLIRGDGDQISARAQPLSTVQSVIAGGGDYGEISALVFAADGALYFATGWERCTIERLDTNGRVTIVAGKEGVCDSSSDSGPVIGFESIGPVTDLAVAPDGGLYIAEPSNHRIRLLLPTGDILPIAGNGTPGFSGDGGVATDASLDWPAAVELSPDGSLLVVDSGNNRIRKIGPDGIIYTVAGNGQPDYSGDDGPAIEAALQPGNVALGPDGSIYIADTGNNRIRRVTNDGIIRTVAGNGTYYATERLPDGSRHNGDGGPSLEAGLRRPQTIRVNEDGTLFIGSGSNVRRVGEYDVIRTLVEGKGGSIAIAPSDDLYLGNYGLQRVANALSDTGRDVFVSNRSGTEIYHFNADGRHLRTLHALTNAELYRFGYTSSGLLSSITDVDDRVTQIERLSDGTPTAIVAPDGQRTVLTLDTDGYLAIVTDPAGNSHRMTYGDDGLLRSLTDPNGHQDRFTYDALGRFVTDTDPLGGGWTLARSELDLGYLTEMTSGEGRVSRFRVESLLIGDRRQIDTDPDGTQTTLLFGADAAETVEHPDGTEFFVQQGPDPRFQMMAPVITEQSVSLPSGLTQERAQTREVTLADSGDPLSLTALTETATVNGRTTTNIYDAASRTLTTTTPEGRGRTTTLDARGRVARSQVSGLVASGYAYDADGRLSQIEEGIAPNTRLTQLGYHDAGDQKGFLEWIQDAESREARFDYDAAGRVVTQNLPGNRVVGYDYDANGNLTSLTPPGRPAHAFSYNAVDLVSRYTPPAVTGGGSTDYSYNLDKQLTQVLRPDGKTLDYTYDAGGRLASLTIPRGTYGYSYNGSGQVSRIEAPDGGALAYTYDGRLRTGTEWTGEIKGQVGFAYDNDFRAREIRVGTDAIAYGYDDDGLLTQAGAMTLGYRNDNGLLSSTALGDAVGSYSYNSFGELEAYTETYGANSLYQAAYSRDRIGRITQKVETISGVSTTYDYAYDTAGRLTEVKRNGVQSESYGYDANDNRTSALGLAGTPTYDDQDRLLTYGDATYAYTANGELSSKTVGTQVTRYDYDVLGNLVGVELPDGTQIEYLIDARNRRVGKKVDGALLQGFLYRDQLNPVAELDADGNVTARFIYADRVNVPSYMVKDGTTYRIVSDHLGSPRLVIDMRNGSVAQRIDYDAFGNVLNDSNRGFQPFGFAGGIDDQDVGLVRFGARDYDAEIGRWTVKDPIRFTGRAYNLFQYVSAEPINQIDRTGLSSSLGVKLECYDLGSDGEIAGYQNGVAATGEQFINNALRNMPENAAKMCLSRMDGEKGVRMDTMKSFLENAGIDSGTIVGFSANNLANHTSCDFSIGRTNTWSGSFLEKSR